MKWWCPILFYNERKYELYNLNTPWSNIPAWVRREKIYKTLVKIAEFKQYKNIELKYKLNEVDTTIPG